MKTLSKLITEGLPVGALVKSSIKTVMQYIGHSKFIYLNTIFKGEEFIAHKMRGEWQPTTAYDSDIDPKTLPIPEPFWTGWAVASHLDGPHKQYPNNRTEEEAFTAKNGWLQIEIDSKPEKKWQWPHKSYCQPCLPPK